jgi:hypothetical protein
MKFDESNTVVYNSENDFVNALVNLGLKPEYIGEILVHERAHLEKAKELGYRVNYCIKLTNKKKIRPGIVVDDDERGFTKEDLIKIFSAPDDPSDDDIKNLKSLEDLL